MILSFNVARSVSSTSIVAPGITVPEAFFTCAFDFVIRSASVRFPLPLTTSKLSAVTFATGLESVTVTLIVVSTPL